MNEQPAIELSEQSARSVTTRARGRRRHPALVGRIVATGVGSTAFFGSLAGIAANPPTWSNSTSAATAGDLSASGATAPDSSVTTIAVPPPTSVVVERIARTFYVDQAGNPVAAPSSTTTIAKAPDQVNAVPRASVASTPTGSDAGATPPPSAARAASPTPAAPSPTAEPAPAPAAPAATTPAPSAPPATAPPATAPPTTAAPAPKPTTPPTTVPACKTSKC